MRQCAESTGHTVPLLRRHLAPLRRGKGRDTLPPGRHSVREGVSASGLLWVLSLSLLLKALQMPSPWTHTAGGGREPARRRRAPAPAALASAGGRAVPLEQQAHVAQTFSAYRPPIGGTRTPGGKD